jgi:putative heme transporter
MGKQVKAKKARVKANDNLFKKPKKTKTKKQKFLTALSYVVSVALIYWLFFIFLPTQINVDQIKTTLQSLTSSQVLTLLIAGILAIFSVGWTATTVLPGIKLTKGTQASVVSQLTAVILPPPADMAIRFAMYKTYGFSVDSSAIAAILSGIARYFTVFAVALAGLFAMLLTGQGNKTLLLWLIGLTILFTAAFWLMKMILKNEHLALKAGKIIQNSANKVRKIFRKKPVYQVEGQVVDFGKKANKVVHSNFWLIVLSNAVWGASCFVILLLAVRFCGIDSSTMSTAYILLVTGGMLVLNSLPLPGSGAGISETILLNIINFPSPQVESAFVAALILYRVYTWILPFPVGAVEYFIWRYQIRDRYQNL